MWLQLFVSGLPIIPASVDRYLQAKLKQYVINPIVNFLYIVFVQSIQWLLTAIYLAIWTVLGAVYAIWQLVYTVLTWGIHRLWWYTTWLGYFVKQFIFRLWLVIKAVAIWTAQDISWQFQTVTFSFIWSYDLVIFMWDQIYHFIASNLQTAAVYIWTDIVWILSIMWFIIKLAILAIFAGIIMYIAVLFYRFFSCRDFALQCKYYFGLTPPQCNQGQGVLTIAPVMLDPQGQGRARVWPPSLAPQAQQ